MANQILIKRGTGTSALANGELGFNTSTNTLYIGNNGNKAIGGSGAFLPLSGGTMTGDLTATGLAVLAGHKYPSTTLKTTMDDRSISYGAAMAENTMYGQVVYNDGKGNAEYYMFPDRTSDETGNAWHSILTSKKPVTIAQGGTGATTAADARKNLAVLYYAKYDAGNLQTGANNISAWVSYYGDDGTNYNQMDLTKTATVFRKPVNIASGGTGATSASGACTNLGAVKKSGDAMTGQLSISHNSFHTLKLIASSSNTAKEASIGFFQDTTEAWTLGVATGSSGTTDFGLYAAEHGLAFKVGKASSDPITLYRHLNSNTSGTFGNSLQVGSNAKRQVLLYSGDDHAKISNQDASWFEYNAMYMYDTHTYFKKPITVLTDQYWIDGKYGVDVANSDIINANGIYFKDDSNTAGEGINFYRSSTTWDTLVASGGKLYFAPNRATSEVGTRYEVYHSGGSVVPVSKGGTGATSASGARTNLGAITMPEAYICSFGNDINTDILSMDLGYGIHWFEGNARMANNWPEDRDAARYMVTIKGLIFSGTNGYRVVEIENLNTYKKWVNRYHWSSWSGWQEVVDSRGGTINGVLTLNAPNFAPILKLTSPTESAISFAQGGTDTWVIGSGTGSSGANTNFGIYASNQGSALSIDRNVDGALNLYRNLGISGNFYSVHHGLIGSGYARQMLIQPSADCVKINCQDSSWFEYNAMYMYDNKTWFKKEIEVDGNIVAKNGGRLAVAADGWAEIQFVTADRTTSHAAIGTSTNTNRLVFIQKKVKSEGREHYYLNEPSSTAGDSHYYIYTTKNLVYSSTQPTGAQGMIWLKPIS